VEKPKVEKSYRPDILAEAWQRVKRNHPTMRDRVVQMATKTVIAISDPAKKEGDAAPLFLNPPMLPA
jgi:hypothetical protein